jgi:hypothetical protein
MPWMIRWAGGFPVFAVEAHGARFRDVDGHEYVDFCLGDTAAMTGHSPGPTVRAVAEQAARGITLMLPSEDALWVGEELARRFGLPSWQFALTATDANRFAIRLARELTGRPKILVFNWCYLGTVDETFAALEGASVVSVWERRTAVALRGDDAWSSGTRRARRGLPSALCVRAGGACLTNIGIAIPRQVFTTPAGRPATGTLLIIDECTLWAGRAAIQPHGKPIRSLDQKEASRPVSRRFTGSRAVAEQLRRCYRGRTGGRRG